MYSDDLGQRCLSPILIEHDFEHDPIIWDAIYLVIKTTVQSGWLSGSLSLENVATVSYNNWTEYFAYNYDNEGKYPSSMSLSAIRTIEMNSLNDLSFNYTSKHPEKYTFNFGVERMEVVSSVVDHYVGPPEDLQTVYKNYLKISTINAYIRNNELNELIDNFSSSDEKYIVYGNLTILDKSLLPQASLKGSSNNYETRSGSMTQESTYDLNFDDYTIEFILLIPWVFDHRPTRTEVLSKIYDYGHSGIDGYINLRSSYDSDDDNFYGYKKLDNPHVSITLKSIERYLYEYRTWKYEEIPPSIGNRQPIAEIQGYTYAFNELFYSDAEAIYPKTENSLGNLWGNLRARPLNNFVSDIIPNDFSIKKLRQYYPKKEGDLTLSALIYNPVNIYVLLDNRTLFVDDSTEMNYFVHLSRLGPGDGKEYCYTDSGNLYSLFQIKRKNEILYMFVYPNFNTGKFEYCISKDNINTILMSAEWHTPLHNFQFMTFDYFSSHYDQNWEYDSQSHQIWVSVPYEYGIGEEVYLDSIEGIVSFSTFADSIVRAFNRN